MALIDTAEQELTSENQKKVKKVRFELPTEQTDLDGDLRERLQHNLLYKDDTIFEHISFFQDIDKEELVQLQKVTKKKDVFNGRKLLGCPVYVSSDESGFIS